MSKELAGTINKDDSAPDSTRRILESLRRTLQEELAKHPPAGGRDKVPVLSGPWGMLTDEGYTWRTQAELSSVVQAETREHFDDNIVREILLAAAGVKLSRTCLSDERIGILEGIADRHGFRVLAGRQRYVHRRDIGKGGACNGVERRLEEHEGGGLRNVYIASDDSLAEAGRLLEEAGDDEIFGILLGIPACCREFYTRSRAIAESSQNDMVMPALDNTPDGGPYDWWVNYPAHYFGRTLLSFFPCSFRCPAASAVARSTFQMLAKCDKAWADSFLSLQQSNILYTEYEGLHLFRRPLVDGVIHYGAEDVASTENTRICELIRQGDTLRVLTKHEVRICRGVERVGTIEGEDVGMCAFW
jgi:hypothetical protein